MEEKLTTLLEYRKHLSDQYADRAALWSLQEAAVDEMADLLVCQLDGMDQAKFRIPRDPRLRCTASLPFGLRLFCFQCFSTFLWLPYRCARWLRIETRSLLLLTLIVAKGFTCAAQDEGAWPLVFRLLWLHSIHFVPNLCLSPACWLLRHFCLENLRDSFKFRIFFGNPCNGRDLQAWELHNCRVGCTRIGKSCWDLPPARQAVSIKFSPSRR